MSGESNAKATKGSIIETKGKSYELTYRISLLSARSVFSTFMWSASKDEETDVYSTLSLTTQSDTSSYLSPRHEFIPIPSRRLGWSQMRCIHRAPSD